MFAPDEEAESAPIWPAFGDLMACLFGLFVLFFVWAVAFQVDLSNNLQTERQRLARETALRAAESERLAALERALAGPLAAGRITLVEGRIGISGSVLFDTNSSNLKAEGKAVLSDVAAPLATYIGRHDSMIMVSGFTDNLPVRGSHKDNWQLSADRALTVTRALVTAGVARELVFAAGFGETHPVASNDTEESRAKNRRVEIAPVPRFERGLP